MRKNDPVAALTQNREASERLDKLEAAIAAQTELVNALLAKLSAPTVLVEPAPEAPPRVAAPAPGGPPSAFMAYVNAQRGMRAEPLPDDPEAPALEAAAEKLAAMHPIDRQAFLDGLRQKGRRDDLRKEREQLGLEPLTDDELDQLLGAGE
jgi:hypothetical protein